MFHERYIHCFFVYKGRICLLFPLIICILLFSHDPGETLRPQNAFDLQAKGALEKVNAKNLYALVAHLQSYGNRSTWEKQLEAANWVSGEFKKIGIEVATHRYEFNGRIWPNVVAKIKGKKRPEEITMLIAHIDSISDSPQNIAPGADDNASGVAVILEVARVLKEFPMPQTVMFVIFTNEEAVNVGSKPYARQAKNDGLNIRAVINLDILGYNRPRWPFYWDAVIGHATLKGRIKAIIKMVRNYSAGVIRGSDVVKVAGREPNRELVSMTSRMIREFAGLKVREIVREHCY